MSWLSVEGLSKRFEGAVALEQASFDLAQGEFFTIVGPTNAGKSTLLKCIAGLVRPDAGTIRLASRAIDGLEPRARRVSLMFQNIALFPTRSGHDNIAFPLVTAGWSRERIEARVAEIARLLGIAHIIGRMPRTFSGGEQQRVALGRALAAPSDLLMLDEPLTNLDARLRIALRLEFKALHRESGQSILYVTHDQTEALSLSDRVGVLNHGRFEQIGTPDALYHRPETEFVARFVGTPPMNLLPASLSGIEGGLAAEGAGFRVAVEGRPAGPPPEAASVGIRPEAIRVTPARTLDTPLPASVLWVERLGSHHILDVRLGEATIKVRTRPDHAVTAEGPAWLGFSARAEHILDRRRGRFLARAD